MKRRRFLTVAIIRRIIFGLLSTSSAVLCLAFVGFWIRSQRTADWWYVQNRAGTEAAVFTYTDRVFGAVDLPLERRDRGNVSWMHLAIPQTPPISTIPLRTFAGFGWYSGNLQGKRGYVLSVPYWGVALLTTLLPAIAFRQFLSRRRQGSETRMLCLTCGYDLRATPDRCPECGTVPAKK